MVIRTVRRLALLTVAVWCGVGFFWFARPILAAAPSPSHSSVEQQALRAFTQGKFDEVLRLLEAEQSQDRLSPKAWRAGTISALRIGKPESALVFYNRLITPGQADDTRLLRELALAFISSRTHDPEEYLRIAAYMTLTEIPSRDVAPLLEDGLLDPSVVVRARAAEGLGRMQPAPPVRVLKRALEDAAPSVRIAALTAIGPNTDASLRPLITRMARSEEGVLPIFASAALARMNKTDPLEELAVEATGPNADARMAALGLLGQLKRPASLPLLNQSVYDPDPTVRAFAAGALGEFGSPKSEPALLHALEDEHPLVRGVAAASLGRLKLAQSQPVLKQAARDPMEVVRVGAVEALLRLGDPEAVLLAADLAKHPDPSIRGAVARAIGLAGNRKAIQVLESLIKDQQPQPRVMAARALGKLGGREQVAWLKQGLRDSDAAVRITAAGGVIQLLQHTGR